MRKLFAIFFSIVLIAPHISNYIFYAGCEISTAFSNDERTTCDCAKTVDDKQAATLPSSGKQKANENNFYWKYLSNKNVHFIFLNPNSAGLSNYYRLIKFATPFLEPVFHPPLN